MRTADMRKTIEEGRCRLALSGLGGRCPRIAFFTGARGFEFRIVGTSPRKSTYQDLHYGRTPLVT